MAVLLDGETDEVLADAVARPAPLPARKRRVEWIHVERADAGFVGERLAAALADPARIEWPAPFRLPARMEARRLLHDTVVRSEGAPLPGALQDHLYSLHDTARIVDGEALRLRLHFDGRLSPLPRPPSERTLARLSHPGWSVVEESEETTITLFPRNPLVAIDHVNAAYGSRDFDVRAEIAAPRPLADAVAKIQAELDAAAGRSARPSSR